MGSCQFASVGNDLARTREIIMDSELRSKDMVTAIRAAVRCNRISWEHVVLAAMAGDEHCLLLVNWPKKAKPKLRSVCKLIATDAHLFARCLNTILDLGKPEYSPRNDYYVLSTAFSWKRRHLELRIEQALDKHYDKGLGLLSVIKTPSISIYGINTDYHSQASWCRAILKTCKEEFDRKLSNV